MYNIALLSSFHVNSGKCNPHELYRIIEEIQPEVIFEELSNDTFKMLYSEGYTPQTIEAITVKAYLQKYPIKHYPVDTYPKNEANLLSDAQIIWEHSDEYRELWRQILLKIDQEGYCFLNSNDCAEMLDKVYTIEGSVLSEINNEKLFDEYHAEKALHDNRENKMLENIYNYSRQYPFNNALFICGAHHRNPLKRKIIEYQVKELITINWTFYKEP